MDTQELETKMMKKIKKMVGHEPVGMKDLLHILVHPDLIDDTFEYVDSHYK